MSHGEVLERCLKSGVHPQLCSVSSLFTLQSKQFINRKCHWLYMRLTTVTMLPLFVWDVQVRAALFRYDQVQATEKLDHLFHFWPCSA